jgi:hypothetical protein
MDNIRNYFTAERNESILFVAVGLIACVFATYFFLYPKESFYRGMAFPLIAVALIQLTVGSSVWLRSSKDITRVEQIILQSPEKIKTEEIPRMEVVMKNFVIYRYVEMALLLAGLICMFIFNTMPLVKGIGIGLFIQSALMLAFDFFAEKRGAEYLEYLKKLWFTNIP